MILPGLPWRKPSFAFDAKVLAVKKASYRAVQSQKESVIGFREWSTNCWIRISFITEIVDCAHCVLSKFYLCFWFDSHCILKCFPLCSVIFWKHIFQQAFQTCFIERDDDGVFGR